MTSLSPKTYVVFVLVVVLVAFARGSALLPDEDVNDDTFAVQFMPAGSLRSNPDAANIPTEQWTTMTAANGTRYDCARANPTGATASEAREARAKLIGKEAKAATRDKVHGVLDGACVMSGKGWWVYEACWGRQVRQYHQTSDDKIETEYALGLGPSHKVAKGATKELIFGESQLHGMYLSAMYTNGTDCDLTGLQRQTEIRVSCAGDDVEAPLSLSEVTEVSTCNYLVVLLSQRACDIPELRKELRRTQQITCYMREGEE
jgi:hypothetical protein